MNRLPPDVHLARENKFEFTLGDMDKSFVQGVFVNLNDREIDVKYMECDAGKVLEFYKNYESKYIESAELTSFSVDNKKISTIQFSNIVMIHAGILFDYTSIIHEDRFRMTTSPVAVHSFKLKFDDWKVCY